MTPRINTGAFEATLNDHARRIDDLDDTVSETRKTVIGIDKTMARLLDKVNLIWRFSMLAAVGIAGAVGTEVWRLIVGR